jgi:hypothetical protein
VTGEGNGLADKREVTGDGGVGDAKWAGEKRERSRALS